MAIPLLLVLLFAAFFWWHDLRGAPLTAAETEERLARLAAKRGTGENAGDHDLLGDLRSLAADDDGRAYFMVNLIRFRKKALYPPSLASLGDDAREADARYARLVAPALLRRGSYPVFNSRVIGRFLTPPGAEPWDSVAIVRYRSRRDMLDMVEALQAVDAGIHKWASIEETHVFPVRPSLLVAPLPIVVGLLLVALGVLLRGLGA
jgi:hypothetical protein